MLSFNIIFRDLSPRKMGKKFEKLTKFCHKGGQFWLFDTFDFIII